MNKLIQVVTMLPEEKAIIKMIEPSFKEFKKFVNIGFDGSMPVEYYPGTIDIDGKSFKFNYILGEESKLYTEPKPNRNLFIEYGDGKGSFYHDVIFGPCMVVGLIGEDGYPLSLSNDEALMLVNYMNQPELIADPLADREDFIEAQFYEVDLEEFEL